MQTVNVCEVFDSIQGESTYAGFSCHFIRLAGCNLRCRYCDSRHAWEPGREIEIDDLVRKAMTSPASIVEITGGEPLMQKAFPELATELRNRIVRPVLVETNGSFDIRRIPEGVVAIMDLKCPASGESGAMDLDNMERLRPQDEVKFVISDRTDYEWARKVIEDCALQEMCHAVLFSPAYGVLEAPELAGWILSDGLPVRLQVQLHRVLGMK